MEYLKSSEPNILAGQASVLFSSAYSAGVANIGAALIIYLLVAQSHIADYAVIWLIGMTLISLIRMGISYWHCSNRVKEKTGGYLVVYFATVLLLGVCWGFAPIIQYQLDDPNVRNFTFLVYLGVVAASVATMSAWLPVFIAFVVPQLTTIVVVLMLEGETVSYYTGLGLVIYTLLMLVLAKNINHRLIDSLTLKSVNLKLIDDLSDEIAQRREAQQELERHQGDLERLVDSRTQELIHINENLQREIDDRQQAEENLERISHYDQLTNLPNRLLLLDRITHAIDVAKRKGQRVVVLFLGLDRFKSINDSLGHLIGDNLLQQVANRLRALLHAEDTIARNGGDEFVVVIERVSDDHKVEAVANKIIESLQGSFNILGHDIHIGVSIGTAQFPADGEDPLLLLESADTAMNRAKQAGGNGFQYYAETMSQQSRERLEMENHLRSAIQRDELFMVYQPQVDSFSGKTVGFESLIRWRNPELGLVGPDRFIPLLEESGMIYPVGEWVIRDVVQFIASGEVGSLRVAINLSALQCSQLGLGDYIQGVVTEYGIDPQQLEFEITESMLIDNLEQSTRLINQLHTMGCTIALDDFGTGYTSMGYLTHLPIDIIKIDRSFVSGIDSDKSLHKIVYAIIGMSQSLDIKNVIEGVETKEELAMVQALEGRIIQGFLFSRPLGRGEELARWLANT